MLELIFMTKRLTFASRNNKKFMAENIKRRTTINKEGVHTLTLTIIVLFVLNNILFLPVISGWWSYVVLGISIIILGLIVNFFRNPNRHFPNEDREKVVVAPADGCVVAIEEVDEPDYFKDRRVVVSIFMSIFSVHANWYPVNGTVIKVEHQDGKYYAAFKPKSSTENERSLIVIKTPEGQEIMVRQIAGALARRIVTYPKVGSESRIDHHLGFIKFGSRVDVYLPVGSLICVKLNQQVTADMNIIAKLP